MNPLEFLDQRASVRAFDPQAQLTEDTIKEMLRHASYAPSSNNFQPWKVIAVKDKVLQKELSRLSANQVQVADASVVFLLYGDASEYDIDKQLAFELKHHILHKEQSTQRRARMEQYFQLHPEDKGTEELRFDVGLFAMNLMHVVRTFGYESVPMRGTDFEQIGRYLAVPGAWVPILLLPVGIPLQKGHPHIRKPVAEFATIM